MSKGHSRIKKLIVKDLKIDAKTKQGPYYYRRIHIFFKNECIMEIDLTGYLHSIEPLANLGEISFHVDDPFNNFKSRPKTKKKKKKQAKRKRRR